MPEITPYIATSILQDINKCSPEAALNQFAEFVNMYSIDGAIAKVDEMKKSYYLKQHTSAIYFSESDNRWRTYVRTKDGKRKAITATTKPYLENKLVEFYIGLQGLNNVTMNALFPNFIAYKAKETSLANANKLTCTYNKFLKGTEIATMPMCDITIPVLKTYFLDTIERYSLTSRVYRDIKSITNMLYDYAIESELLTYNVSRNMSEIPYKKFAPAAKKQASERIYVGDEETVLQENALEEFKRTDNIAYLAICLNFALGLRVGELVALRYDDFTENYLHICRQEVATYITDSEGKIVRDGCEVVPYVKSLAGDRRIPITSAVRVLLRKIREVNQSNGIDSPYLFISKCGNRLHKNGVNNALRRLNKKLGITQRANHSIRRTCISNMNASNLLTDEEIREFAGHSEISTTQNSYIYATEEPVDRIDAYEGAISPKMARVFKGCSTFLSNEKAGNPCI